MTLRWWALNELLKSGISEESIWEPQRQPVYIESGPYRWLRHPAYLGSMLSLSGFGISALGWGGVVLALPAWPFFALRIYQENELRCP